MKTVKEVSELTGVSARALHWYDRIGLLKPTAHSGAGYRLYDDEALETLRQIVYLGNSACPSARSRRSWKARTMTAGRP